MSRDYAADLSHCQQLIDDHGNNFAMKCAWYIRRVQELEEALGKIDRGVFTLDAARKVARKALHPSQENTQ